MIQGRLASEVLAAIPHRKVQPCQSSSVTSGQLHPGRPGGPSHYLDLDSHSLLPLESSAQFPSARPRHRLVWRRNCVDTSSWPKLPRSAPRSISRHGVVDLSASRFPRAETGWSARKSTGPQPRPSDTLSGQRTHEHTVSGACPTYYLSLITHHSSLNKLSTKRARPLKGPAQQHSLRLMMEAAGIEPASENESSRAATCVAYRLFFSLPVGR